MKTRAGRLAGNVSDPMNEQQRRTPRVVCVVPLTLSRGDARSLQARSAVINAHGALIISPEPIPERTPVTLINQNTGSRVEACVVWTGLTPEPPHSLSFAEFKLGVEFREQAAEFWGSDYLQALRHLRRGVPETALKPI